MAMALGVSAEPMTATLSLTMSSCASRLELSGTPPSSLMMRSIFLPPTLAPFLSMYILMPAWTCLPTGASPPVSGSTTPTFKSSAKAPVAASVAAASAIPTIRSMRFPLRRVVCGNLYRNRPPVMAQNGLYRNNATTPRSRQRKALCMRPALRVDDLLELAEHAHAGQQLRQAGVRLALPLDRGDEFAVLELDAVHGDVDLGDVDLVVLAVAEVVVERLVGAVVADVAEERAERAVVVERERQGQDRARRHLGHDAHVHGDAELRVGRALHRVAIGNRLAGLVLEQVDGMGGVMPKQMVGPAARIARRVDVLAAEVVGLHVHLLDLELALLDALVNPLMARIEAAHMPAHGDNAALLRDLDQLLGVLDAVGDRDFDQDVLTRAHHLLALPEVHLRRRGQDHRVGTLDALGKIAGVMGDAVFLGDFGGGVLIAAHERRHLDVGNALERVEMFLTERALAGDTNFHRCPLLAMR